MWEEYLQVVRHPRKYILTYISWNISAAPCGCEQKDDATAHSSLPQMLCYQRLKCFLDVEGKKKMSKPQVKIVFILSLLSFITLFTIKYFKERLMTVRDDYLQVKAFILNLVSDWTVTTVLKWKVTMVVSWLKLTVLALTSCTEEFCMHYYSTECPKIFGYHLSRKACSSSLCPFLHCKLLFRDSPSASKVVQVSEVLAIGNCCTLLQFLLLQLKQM